MVWLTGLESHSGRSDTEWHEHKRRGRAMAVVLLPSGHPTVPGHTFGSHNLGSQGVCYWHWWVSAGMLQATCTAHKSPTTENHPAPDVSRARVETSGARGLPPSSRQEIYSLNSNWAPTVCRATFQELKIQRRTTQTRSVPSWVYSVMTVEA